MGDLLKPSIPQLFQASSAQRFQRAVLLSVESLRPRGMHFQAPPHDHDKLVYCLAGRALDVVLDLRNGSPTFGRAISVLLNSNGSEGVYVPQGCAHGFLSLESETMLLYHVTSEYSRDFDCGIRWDSIPFTWPVKQPLVSERDMLFQPLVAFRSPFIFKG